MKGVFKVINNTTIKQRDYERASSLLGELFAFDSDITDEINKYIQIYGVEGFFKKLATFDFSVDVYEKLNAVKLVLFGLGEDVLNIEYGDKKIRTLEGGAGLEAKLR